MRSHTAAIRERVSAARAARRAEAGRSGVDEGFVSLLVDRFYARIREDDLLGPIFAARVGDWEMHLDRMKAFWRSVLFNSGEFSGNPMLRHMAIPGLQERHFVHWLELFYATLRDLDAAPEGRTLVAVKARSIADSLLTGIETRRRGLAGANAGKDLPHA